MNNIIRKYKDRVINIQSSRILVRIQTIIYFIIIIMTIYASILGIKTNTSGAQELWKLAIIMIGLFVLFLYQKDWSVKNENNILYVRKWIFTYKIPYKDLIDIKQIESSIFRRDFHSCEYLIIIYKKGKKLKLIEIEYLFKFEYVKKSQIMEFINTFFKSVELIENRKESNPLLTDYKNIRTEQEEKEIDNMLNLEKKIEKMEKVNEEKAIWIGICAFVILFIIFVLFIIKACNN